MKSLWRQGLKGFEGDGPLLRSLLCSCDEKAYLGIPISEPHTHIQTAYIQDENPCHQPEIPAINAKELT